MTINVWNLFWNLWSSSELRAWIPHDLHRNVKFREPSFGSFQSARMHSYFHKELTSFWCTLWIEVCKKKKLRGMNCAQNRIKINDHFHCISSSSKERLRNCHFFRKVYLLILGRVLASAVAALSLATATFPFSVVEIRMASDSAMEWP